MPANKSAVTTLLLKWSGLLLALGYLLYMNEMNDVPVDSGDGIAHYSYARNSWDFHGDFLSHWAKPLFTLLASPFAQISFKAYIGFNILVFAFTCLTAFSIFRKFSVAKGYYFFFPLLMLTVPEYIYCILGGLTEPLFGLLLLLMIRFAFYEKWIMFAIIASFTIFSRSEGMLLICFGFLLLVYNKQWKAMPFLLTGFIIYGFAGLTHYDTFFWYFTKDPYQTSDIYGHGAWNHYLLMWRNYIGIGLLVLTPVSFFGWYVIRRNKEIKSTGIALFAVITFVSIIAIHSYLWASGMKGSLGLTRLAILGLTGFATIVFVGLDRVTRELHFLVHAILFLVFGIYIFHKEETLNYPRVPDNFQQLVIESADYVLKYYPERKVKFYHPLFGFRTGSRLLNDPLINMYWFNNDTNMVKGLDNGEIIVRDGQFGPAEAGLSLEMIKKLPEMKEVKTFKSKDGLKSYTDEYLEVVIYEIRR